MAPNQHRQKQLPKVYIRLVFGTSQSVFDTVLKNCSEITLAQEEHNVGNLESTRSQVNAEGLHAHGLVLVNCF